MSGDLGGAVDSDLGEERDGFSQCPFLGLSPVPWCCSSISTLCLSLGLTMITIVLVVSSWKPQFGSLRARPHYL